MLRLLLVAAITGCGFGNSPARLDAGFDGTPLDATAPDAYRCIHVHLDAGDWGAACPGNGLCHDGLGWCIEGACRPQCVQPLACLACEGTGERISAAGQCYCSP